MRQGTYISIPMLIAEEPEVDLKQVPLEHAPPNEKLYGNTLLAGVQVTGASTAIRAAWQPLRQAGAIAGNMLVYAAAKCWNVDPASCHARSGEVRHVPTGKSIKYGELVADAARVAVSESVVLKRPEDFKLIGTPATRLDAPEAVAIFTPRGRTSMLSTAVRPIGRRSPTDRRVCSWRSSKNWSATGAPTATGERWRRS
jgi:isoquinoline 1-oxidoreductase beta subunit